jgi:hypothetical protein
MVAGMVALMDSKFGGGADQSVGCACIGLILDSLRGSEISGYQRWGNGN